MRVQCLPAALVALALLAGAAAPAAAGAARCGGYVRQIASGDVEVSVRDQRIEVRLRDPQGAPRMAEGVAAFTVGGEARQVTLVPRAPGLLTGDAPGAIASQSIRLRLVFADGAVGAARFPVRPATCAPASDPSP